MASIQEITAPLLEQIAEARQRGDNKLPPERELSVLLGTSRTTLRRALERFEEQGLLKRVVGRAGGAYITGDIDLWAGDNTLNRKIDRSLNDVIGVPSMLREQGFRDGTRVIATGIQLPTPEVALNLQIAEDEPVISLQRLRFADDEPLSLEQMYLPLSRFPDLLDQKLDSSLYELLDERYGVAVARSEENIDVDVIATNAAALLDIRPQQQAFVVRRIAYDHQGTPIETSTDLFRLDKTRLVVRTENPVTANSLSLRPGQARAAERQFHRTNG